MGGRESEKDRLLARLYEDPEREFLGLHIFPGDAPGDEELVCREVNRALDEASPRKKG